MSKLSKLEVNESLEEITLEPVSRLDLIKYAGASGDYNPIHTIDEEAKKAGLPGIIAHGMWTMGNLAKLFTPYLEEGFISEYKVRFRDMVMLSDVITLRARATLKEKSVDRLRFDCFAVNQDGKTVVAGEVIFSMYS